MTSTTDDGAAATARPRRRHLDGVWAVALLLVSLAFFLPGFFSVPPLDRDEPRFAQASRQMVESGDFVDIRFQDETRYKKPVGIYWLQSAAVLISGQGAEAPIWVYRLPSLLGAVLAVLLTAWAGARLFGPAVGLIGALMLAGTVLLGVEARLAKTDAALLAAIVLAEGALANLYLKRDREVPAGLGTVLLLWLAVGIGLLLKGPVILLVTGGTAAALALSEWRGRWLRQTRPLLGLIVVALLVLPWLIAITVKSDGAFWAASLGHDMLGKVAGGQESHGAPPGTYLGIFWITFWPFAAFAGLALPWVWRNRGAAGVRFCLAWIVPTWIVFELVPTKLPHYLLPVFPAIALLIAGALVEGFPVASARRRRWLLWGPVGLAILLAALFTAGGVALPWWLEGAPMPIALLASLVAAGIVLLLVLYAERWSPGRLLAGLLVGAFCFYAVAWQGVIPHLEALWLSPRAVAAVETARRCPESLLLSSGFSEPSLVFLLDQPVRFGDGAAAAENLLAAPDCALSLVVERNLPAFEARLGEAGAKAVALASVEGINYSRGSSRRVLTLYRLTEPSGAE